MSQLAMAAMAMTMAVRGSGGEERCCIDLNLNEVEDY